MRDCKLSIQNFLANSLSLHAWTWLRSIHHNYYIHRDHEKHVRAWTVGIVFGFSILLFSPSYSSADMPMGGLKQRIGNYEVSVKTDPQQPEAGTSVKILLTIAAVNGGDISGIPVDLTIKGDGTVLSDLDRPIAVPYGHYTYQYKFENPGTYSLVIDIYDIYFTGRQVPFTFPIEVKSTFFGLRGPSDMVVYFLLPLIVIIVSIILALILWQKRKTKLGSILHDDKR